MPHPDNVIVVETRKDTLRACSLRAAVEAANTGTTVSCCHGRPGHNTIRLRPGEYRLTMGSLVISGDVTIKCERYGKGVTITGTSTGTVIRVQEGGRLTLLGVTVAGGGGPLGAGIVNEGCLLVRDSTLAHNVATGGKGASSPCVSTPAGNQDCAGGGGGGGAGLGGALYNTGAATLLSSRLRANAAVGGDGGGSAYPIAGQFCDTGGQGGGPEGGAPGGYSACFGIGTDGGSGGFASGGGGGGAAAAGGGNGGTGGFGGGGGGGGGKTSGNQNAHGGPGGVGAGNGGEPGGSAGGGGGGGAGIGGAIFNHGGTVHIVDCHFQGNSVAGGKGGAFGGAGNGQGLCPDVFAHGGLITIWGRDVEVEGCTANGGVIQTCPPIRPCQPDKDSQPVEEAQ